MPVQPASRSADALDPRIEPEDRKADRLTLEQVRTLVNWADCQEAWLFDGAPLSMILGLFHASAKYETLEAWLSEEPYIASRAYNRFARPNGMAPVYEPQVRCGGLS